MKTKYTIIGIIGTTAIITTAYATCYLNQVVCCVTGSTQLTSQTLYCSTGLLGSGGTPFYPNIYADEDGYRFDTYAVGAGGKVNSGGITTYCSGESQQPNSVANPGPPGNLVGFKVYFSDPCRNITATDVSGSSNYGAGSGATINYYSVTTHYVDNTSSGCN